jgi:hypothetical protein
VEGLIGGKLENGDVKIEVEDMKTYNIAPQIRPGQTLKGVMNIGSFSYFNYLKHDFGNGTLRMYPPWVKTGPDAFGNFKYSLTGYSFLREVIGIQTPTTIAGVAGKYYSLTINIATYVTAMPGAFDYVNQPPARINLYATNGNAAQDVLIARSNDINAYNPANERWPFHPGKRQSQVKLYPVAPMPAGKTYFRMRVEHDTTWTATKDIYLPSHYFGDGNPPPPQLAFWDFDFNSANLYEEDMVTQDWIPTAAVTPVYTWEEERIVVPSGNIKATITIPEDSLLETYGGNFSFYSTKATAYTVTMSGGSTSYTSPSTAGAGWRHLTGIPATVFDGATVLVTVNSTDMEKPTLYANIGHQDTDGFYYYKYTDVTAGVSEVSINRLDTQVSTCTVTLREDNGSDLNDVFAPGKRFRVSTNTLSGQYNDTYYGQGANAKNTVFVGSINVRRATYPYGARPEIKVLVTNAFNTLLEKSNYALHNLENYNKLFPYMGIPTVNDTKVTTPKAIDVDASGSGNADLDGLWRLEDGAGNMTLLDAVMLTRNSQFGFVWFDRFNRINTRSTMPVRSTKFVDTAPGPGEFSYSNVNLNFGTDNIINYVSVTAYTQASAIAPAEGGFEITSDIAKSEFAMWDQESINKNRKAEYKLEMFLLFFYDDIETKILDKYKDPQITADVMKFPVRTTDELALVSQMEIYEWIELNYTGKLDQMSYRVNSIRHTIKPGETWVTELGFGLNTDSVLW